MELYGINFNEKNISDVFDIVSKHKACVKEEVFKNIINISGRKRKSGKRIC